MTPSPEASNPTEPAPSDWQFPSVDLADEGGLLAVGGDLDPGTVLQAYRSGIFPMPLGPDDVIGWWSPDPRAVIPLDGLSISRSLAKSVRRYRVTFDRDFEAVVAGCADPARPHGWINSDIQRAYRQLHELGWAHSVEVWDRSATLVGGLYGVAIGGLFAGESMFYHKRDASKVAMVALVAKLRSDGAELFDVQWQTPHLQSMGAVEIPREEYRARLASVVNQRSKWSA
ncbi:MAG: leucyl/phenylalanyl-tRNA--protein transferase [Acidimicrobiia bacterium]|nr:leucyl/phenylalanyl-tRNA--protein transferase [Acidimicrobiia bacterium]